MLHVRMGWAVKEEVMYSFGSVLTGRTVRQVGFANTVEEGIEWNMSHLQLHEHTGLGPGQMVSHFKIRTRGQLCVNLS